MAWIGRALVGLALLAAAACSPRAAIEGLTSPEERAFATGFVEDLRGGDLAGLRPHFDDPQWAESAPQLPRARPLFPHEGATELIGYHVSTVVADGNRTTTKTYALVTGDGDRWTRTLIQTVARGGPATVTAWNVEAFAEPPPKLELYRAMEAAVPWLRAAGRGGHAGGGGTGRVAGPP
ncbi:MAG TPA: hypothetical protein VGW34_10895 [Allosphingosinicella sp.]|nr:hypothetical protein [Allosphingosinicella sp.]